MRQGGEAEMNRRTFVATGLTAGGMGSVHLGGAPAAGVPRRIRELAPRPPLGWNSFDSYGVYLHEEAAMANLEAMAVKLKPFGYEYFVVDNGWFGEYKLVPGTRYAAEKHAADVRINEYGLLQPSKTYFPNGMKRLIDRAHGLGLKFGVHLMRGIPRKAVEQDVPIQGTKYTARQAANTASTCQWCHYNYGVNMEHPAGQAFLNSLVNQLAGWGIDLIKTDDLVPFPDEIEGFAKAIEQCGREMVLSLSPGGKYRMTALPYYRRGNMLRVTEDIWDRQSDLDKAFEAWRRWQGRECPGFWIDLDMIPFGQLQMMSPKEHAIAGGAKLAGVGNKRMSELSQDQMRTFITQRAMAASPLMVGGDLPTLDAFSLSLLTNREMLACDQNGVMGMLVWEKDGVEVWQTPERTTVGRGWLGIFNRTGKEQSVSLGAKELGLEASRRYAVEGVWEAEKLVLGDAGRAWRVAANGVGFYRFARQSG